MQEKVPYAVYGQLMPRAQLFKANNVVTKRNVKTLIIKDGIYADIFAEKMWVAFANATHMFSANIPVN